MATLLVCGHSEDGTRKPTRLLVANSFEEVLDKICPITPFTSSLENRASMIFTLPDGRSCFVNTQIVRVLDEANDDDVD